MSGWYVEVLLINRDSIRSSVLSREEKIDNLIIVTGNDISDSFLNKIINSELNNTEFISILGDDLYSDLLDVERTYNKLYLEKSITQDEISSLKYILFGTYTQETRGTKITIFKNFQSLCSKIAYILGDYFTDEGYIEMIKEKYNLTPEQVNKIYKYMKSEYRLREMILG